MSKQGWEAYKADALKRLEGRDVQAPSQPTQTLGQTPQAPTTAQAPTAEFDPAAAFRAHQATEQTRQRELAQQHAAERELTQTRARELSAFIERLRMLLSKKGSPGLTSFEIQLTYSMYEPAVRRRSGRIISPEKETPPTYRTEWGWEIASIQGPGDYISSPRYNLMLCRDGALWVTLGARTYLDISDETGNFTLTCRQTSLSLARLEADIIPGVARLVDNLNLQWDGN